MKIIISILFTALATVGLYANTNRVYLPLPNDKMNTENLIQQQLMLERLPIMSKEKEVKNLEIENKIVIDFTYYLKDLDEKSRLLYNQDSPFGEMAGISSEPKILEATAGRRAKKDSYDIRLLRLAKSDSFMSESIPRNKVLPAGNFIIRIGEESIPVRFSGGTLAALEKAIKNQVGERLDVSLINDTTETSILVIRGKQTGERNKIRFEEDTQVLFEIQMLGNITAEKNTISVDMSVIQSMNKHLIQSGATFVKLMPQNDGLLDLIERGIKIAEKTQLVYQVIILPATPDNNLIAVLTTNFSTNMITNIFDKVYTNITTNVTLAFVTNTNRYSDFELLAMEAVKISNIKIEGGSLITHYFDNRIMTNTITNITTNEFKQVETNLTVTISTNTGTNMQKVEIPPVTNFTDVLSVVFDDGIEKRIPITISGYFTNFLGVYRDKTVSTIKLKNHNTDRQIIITNMAFYTPLEEGGVQPLNFLSKACDSLFTLNGVEIRRTNNNIDDVLDGVTINLKRESDELVKLEIDHHYDKILASVSNWVKSYNTVMELLYIMTKPETNFIPLSEREEGAERDSVFRAEYSFISLKNKMRNIAMEAYRTRFGAEIALLEQIGIYTKKAGAINKESVTWEDVQKGLLTLDTDKFKKVLSTRFSGITELFGNDTDGDFVKDSGAAVSVNNLMKGVLGKGNFLENRIALNQDKIKAHKKDIQNLEAKVVVKEEILRKKYGDMNSKIQETEAKSKWMQGQFKQ